MQMNNKKKSARFKKILYKCIINDIIQFHFYGFLEVYFKTVYNRQSYVLSTLPNDFTRFIFYI